jgi:hypothetical protein
MGAYNYERFDDYVESGRAGLDFDAFRDILHVGDKAPDFTTTLLDDGSEVQVGDMWKRRPVVMEFGSFT